MTYFNGIPFHQIGKGEQCLISTNLALAHKRAKESNLILIEEPENHLSHTKLNQLIKSINDKCKEKQIIITTHNNFVANKLKLKNLILLNEEKDKRTSSSFNSLEEETYKFFEKLPGYETLRMILCKKAILVEGASDELIIQRAFMDKNNNALPIEKEIDVISVKGLAFKRFLDVAKMIKKPVAVVADNDGNFEKNIENKYKGYKQDEFIKIFADKRVEFPTLEPQIADANKDEDNLKLLCKVLQINSSKYHTPKSVADYMEQEHNKTECALKIFNANAKEKIKYPDYINNAIDWCNEQKQ
ncbi:ATP-dependent nuclease [Candidatus Endomicrobiellum trichonymphae]|uniref:ATP-dependent nuclease n=1 Tax=Endomicrobium trichonymphae TaxID=1408204 RepID=UPI0018D50D56|nr:TOPRIM nucleotidyl transferase/hydrolase domain-containing protein [Candidatus Endomicrobium trichonymphae]